MDQGRISLVPGTYVLNHHRVTGDVVQFQDGARGMTERFWSGTVLSVWLMVRGSETHCYVFG